MSATDEDRPFRAWWRYRAPWALLILSLLLGVGAWRITADLVQRSHEQRFALETRQIESQLRARVTANIQVLRGALGLLRAAERVTRDECGRARHEARVRAEAPSQPEALRPLFRDYAVHPPGERPLLTAIVYLEPFASRNLRAFGYDMFSEPVRREAMERARDTGEPALSGKVTLVQETDTDVQPGFLVFLPVYRPGPAATVEQRRGRLAGFVYSPLRAHDLMRGTFGHGSGDVRFAVYDGESANPDTLLFANAEPSPLANPLRRRQRMQIAGHTWTVAYETLPGFGSRGDILLPGLVGLASLCIGALVYGVALSWARTRDRALRMAQRMTADLRRSEAEAKLLSQRLAESNEDLQQFAYAASHDLKEPLRTISSSLGLVSRRFGERLDDSGREFLNYAMEGARRLAELVEQLLEYSRVQTQPAVLKPLDLGEAVQTAMDDLGALIRETGARIEYARLPQVTADFQQMTQVFQNLFSNAIKYSRGPGRTPQVRVSAEPGAHGWTIRVQDNGIGIAPEHHDRIFGMFKRLHPREEYEGSGMGLAVCKRIVQRHGGSIWVESEPGKGATFCFTLPTADSERRAA
ncbi:MAG: CHASE domain-containing protein [Gammaproteobacteria bacterium]|nr:CHASE domain-containing protein [Gammaproteobacteria bacterium]